MEAAQSMAIGVGILEDQRVFRECLAEALEGAGVKVLVNSGNPKAFVADLVEKGPNVAIIDIGIENEDGNEMDDGLTVLRELRDQKCTIPTLVLSGSRTPEHV